MGATKLRLSTETLQLYARAWARFARFCAEHGQPALPTSSETVTAFLAQSGAGRAALGRYLAAIGHKHRQHGFAPPGRDPGLRAALRLAGRTVPRTNRCRPLSPAQLQSLAQSCPGDLAGRRDRTLLLLAATGLGRAALVGLQAEQLRFTERGSRAWWPAPRARDKSRSRGAGLAVGTLGHHPGPSPCVGADGIRAAPIYAARPGDVRGHLLVGGLDAVAGAGAAGAVAGAALRGHALPRVGVTDLDPANTTDPLQARELPTQQPSAGTVPILSVDGFEGPLDWVLEMARAQRIDLAQLSILALVEAFTAALNSALAEQRERRFDLTRWGEWLVMAATLTLLRSRLLLPKDAPEARAAQDEAEALRRLLLGRAAMQRAAAWLDRRAQLGRDMFGRGGGIESTAAAFRIADITDLFRACLLALRVPDQADSYQLHRAPFWRVADAVARITRMLAEIGGRAELGLFLPDIDRSAPERALRCRTALASTFLAGLELAREGAVRLEQEGEWQAVIVRDATAANLREDDQRVRSI